MKIRTSFLLFGIALLLGSSCRQEGSPPEGTLAGKALAATPAFKQDGSKNEGRFKTTEDSIRLFVTAPNGVSLRAQPSATAPEVIRALYGEEMAYSANSAFPNEGGSVIIEGIPAYWTPVTYKGKTGYIPDITVLCFPPPKTSDTDLKSWIGRIAKPLGPRFVKEPNWDKMGDRGTGLVRQLYNNGAVYTEGSGYEWGHTMLQLPGNNVRSVFFALRNLRGFGSVLKKGGPLRAGKYEVPGPYAPYKWTVEMEENRWLRSVEINWEEGSYNTLRILQVEDEILIINSSGV